jgi:transposase
LAFLDIVVSGVSFKNLVSTKEQAMKFVGIDLHKQTIVICVVNQEKKVLQRKRLLCVQTELIRDYFASLGDFQAVIEATASYEWLVAILDPLAKRVVLAHPYKMRIIAESAKKSDKLDAQMLAEFLAVDMIPEAYRPSSREREHRVLVRHRVLMRRQVSRLKVKIRRVLANYNADRKNLFSVEGLAYLQEVTATTLSAADRFVMKQLRTGLRFAEKQLKQAHQRLRQFAKKAPAREKEARELLRTAPGVGEVVSEVVLAELGKMSRFSSAKKVCAYSGLAPARRQSAGKSKDLGISKQGSSFIRWVMVQAAWQAVRVSLKWRAVYDDTRKRRGNRKAIVAVARRLLAVLYALVRTGQPYRYVPQECSRAKEAATPL